MKRKEKYYLNLKEEVNLFLKGLDNMDFFVLKSVVLSKDFKEFYKQRQDYVNTPSLFSKKELELQRIY